MQVMHKKNTFMRRETDCFEDPAFAAATDLFFYKQIDQTLIYK